MTRERITVVVLVALLAALPIGLDRLRSRAASAWTEAQRYEDVYYLPPREWLPALSLGWDEALADLIWMRALIYYGDELAHGGDVEFVFHYGEAIETLDPDFVAVYHWVGTAGLYRPQAITTADIERTVDFMERGAHHHPLDGDLAWALGAVLAFELAPTLEDQDAANAARARAVPFLLRAQRLGAAPDWAGLSNAALLARMGRDDRAAQLLEEALEQTDDPVYRERLMGRLRQIRGSIAADATDAMLAEEDRARRERFPYAPRSLFLLLGERPPVDLVAPIRDGLPAALAASE